MTASRLPPKFVGGGFEEKTKRIIEVEGIQHLTKRQE